MISPAPSGLLRVVAIADRNNGWHHPKRYTVEDNTVLFTLDFFVSADRTLECQSFPINFYWIDCGDNTIVFSDRDEHWDIKTGISQHIFDPDGSRVTDTMGGFYSYNGAPDTCLPDEQPSITRYVDFYNGNISINCSMPIDSIRAVAGDVNLNGLPFEIGDVVVFFNYFIAGLRAFTINVDSQIVASDVNGDGIPLTVQDYYLLQARAFGDTVPDPSTIYAPLKIRTDASKMRLDFGSTVPVSMLWLCLYSPGHSIDFNLADSHAVGEFGDTICMFAPYRSDKLAARTVEVRYQGEIPTLIHCDAAGPNGERIIYRIVNDNLPKDFSLDQNYPNPFNSATSITFALPVRSDWQLQIFNISGQIVRSFSGNDLGFKSILWDAKSDNGTDLPSGVYFCRLKSGAFSESKKMLLLK